MNRAETVGTAVRQELETLVSDRVIRGFSLAFVDREQAELSYHGVMGAMAPYSSRPVEKGLFYDLASLSKVVGTASRILQLAEEGQLSMDTPVSRLLPGFLWKEITVGQLLLHNSGLPAEIPDKPHLTRDNILERLFLTAPEAGPGERFEYSDVGYILLGLIIREGEGLKERMSLGESFRRHVFGPLGMDHTSFPVPEQAGLCIPTEMTENRGLICGEIHDSKAWLLGESGSAGLFSTLEDLVTFVRAYLTESDRLFTKETFRLIRETERFGRTYGWSREYGEGTLYHTGFTGTSILMDLDRSEGMILLTNRVHPDRDNPVFLEKRKKINQLWLKGSR
jgi:CubicO group peptidase (beta-lactamase class C family)